MKKARLPTPGALRAAERAEAPLAAVCEIQRQAMRRYAQPQVQRTSRKLK